MSWTPELEIAERVAERAGRLLLERYDHDVRVAHKAGDEPVTEADRASNRFIVSALLDAFPDDEVVAEESADRTASRTTGRVWMVDPMDGTKEFLAGNGEFSVMIGLVVDGRPVLGVVHRPTESTTYRGGRGVPAERVTADGIEPLRVSHRADLADLLLVLSRSHRPRSVDAMIERLGIRSVDQSGSVGLKVARIARGTDDLYLHPSPHTKLWDACAPQAVLEAAGGVLTDFDGEPISYDTGDLFNRRGLLASNGAVHGEIVSTCSGLFDPGE